MLEVRSEAEPAHGRALKVELREGPSLSDESISFACRRCQVQLWASPDRAGYLLCLKHQFRHYWARWTNGLICIRQCGLQNRQKYIKWSFSTKPDENVLLPEVKSKLGLPSQLRCIVPKARQVILAPEAENPYFPLPDSNIIGIINAVTNHLLPALWWHSNSAALGSCLIAE